MKLKNYKIYYYATIQSNSKTDEAYKWNPY